jgi:hypothetical protein
VNAVCAVAAAQTLFFNHTVHLYAPVGAHGGARRATDAVLRRSGVSEMVSFIINFLRLKAKHIGRTSHNAKVASFTTLRVDFYGSVYFCHITISYLNQFQ